MRKSKNIFLLLFFIIIFSYVVVAFIGHKLNPKIFNYATVEAKRISTTLINESVNNIVEKSEFKDNLYSLVKNEEDEIEIIDFDTQMVNKLLKLISENVQKDLLLVENGQLDKLKIGSSIKGGNFPNVRKGLVCEIPAGSIFGNSLLANTGPIIPVRLSFIGKVLTTIGTTITNYGINNAYLEVSVNIKVYEKITMPTMTKDVVISKKIPIVMKVVQGKIPNYYNKEIKSTMYEYTLPFSS